MRASIASAVSGPRWFSPETRSFTSRIGRRSLQHERVAEGQDRVLTLPRTWTPSRRRREIIQGIGEAQQPLRAMRTKARDGFITALRDAHRWASKKKGLWMGGLPSLGYDVKDRKLVVNETEADTVRMIFRRYLELGSVRALKAALEEEGVVSKLRRAADGSPYGGNSFSRGALCLMLQNRIYRGEIVHKGAANPGEHAAIVGEELWSSVQRRLETNRVERHEKRDAAAPNFLTGILIDASGEPMTPTHAVKKGVRYRYYVSRRLVTGTRGDEGNGQTSGQRIP